MSEPIHPRDIVGTLETRRICGGVTRATLIKWRDRRGFPAPLEAPKAGVELFDRREVRAWHKAWLASKPQQD